MECKYVIFNHCYPVILSSGLSHNEVAACSFRATSAGFFSIRIKDGKAHTVTYGESVSLKLKSEKDDASFLDQLLRIGDYAEGF